MNYADMKLAIANWLKRDDLTTDIPNFISIAHKSIQRIRDWQGSLFIEDFYVPTTSQFDLSNTAYKVKNLKGFYIIDDEGNVDRELVESSYKLINKYDFSDDIPSVYIKEGSNYFVSPIPTNDYSSWKFRVMYCGWLPDYANDTDTDWLMDDWDALLYKSLLNAEPFLMNDGRLKVWAELYNSAISEMGKVDRDAEVGKKLVNL